MRGVVGIAGTSCIWIGQPIPPEHPHKPRLVGKYLQGCSIAVGLRISIVHSRYSPISGILRGVVDAPVSDLGENHRFVHGHLPRLDVIGPVVRSVGIDIMRPPANKVSHGRRCRVAQREVRVDSRVVEQPPEGDLRVPEVVGRVGERPVVDCSHPAYHGAPVRIVRARVKLVQFAAHAEQLHAVVLGDSRIVVDKRRIIRKPRGRLRRG